MTTALRIANAVAEARLRAKAELMALGTPEECIGFWQGKGPHCGLTVCGFLVCEVFVWDIAIKRDFEEKSNDPFIGFMYKHLAKEVVDVTDETIIVQVTWCGDPKDAPTARSWVPTPEVIACYQRNAS